MSLGLDQRWRRQMLRHIVENTPTTVADIATGTGDVLCMLARSLPNAKVVGVDISAQMMAVAQKKLDENLLSNASLVQADGLSLPFDSESFAAVSCAFGVRNFQQLECGLTEMYRVLTKNGRLCVLELSVPENWLVKPFYLLYTKAIIPLIALAMRVDKQAYAYLPTSVVRCPQGEAMERLLRRVGFSRVERKGLSLGVCTLYIADK